MHEKIKARTTQLIKELDCESTILIFIFTFDIFNKQKVDFPCSFYASKHKSVSSTCFFPPVLRLEYEESAIFLGGL